MTENIEKPTKKWSFWKLNKFWLKLWFQRPRSISIIEDKFFILYTLWRTRNSSKIHYDQYRFGIEYIKQQNWDWNYKTERNENGRTSRQLSFYFGGFSISIYLYRKIKEKTK